MLKSKLLPIAVLCAVLLSSCSSSTMINSDPSGAKVYVNGMYKGMTPYHYSDTKIVGSSTNLKLTKEGYEDLQTIISRDEQLAVGPLIGGLFVLVPWLWIMGYDNDHTYELQPAK